MSVEIVLPAEFGRYRLLERLGEGGMGTVYRARDLALDREVALKTPRFTDRNRPQLVERFQREARKIAAVDHPCLCRIHEVGEIDGTPYLTMPLHEGNALSDLVGRPWPVGTASALVRKLAAALQAMHDRGLMHRDIKPANVLLRTDGEPVIIDFGLARSFTGADDRLTRTGETLGTPAYMPLEQVEGDTKAVGPGVDIYALGVVLFELLTGSRPFEGEVHSIIAQILKESVPAPSTRRPDLTLGLDAVCLQATARMPADRFGSMTAFARALADASRDAPTGTPPEPRFHERPPSSSLTEQTLPSDTHHSATRKRGRRLVIAAALILLLLIPAIRLAIPPDPDPNDPDEERPTPVEKPIVVDLGNGATMTMVRVEKGRFRMGKPDDADGKDVDIEDDFLLGSHEVTQQQWQAVMGSNPSDYSREGGKKEQVAAVDDDELKQFPVESVTFDDVQRFLKNLNDRQKDRGPARLYRLPREVEWEYACRGGRLAEKPTPFAISSHRANFNGLLPFGDAPEGPSLKRPCRTGTYSPNVLGLYDMYGNVWEWCSDRFDHDRGADRIIRGGGWYSSGAFCTPWYRSWRGTVVRFPDVGIRVAATLSK